MNRFVRSVVFSAFATCLSAPAMAALPESGMWAIDGELNGRPGRGIQIDRQSGLNVIVTYYGYRTDGSALFLQAAGQLKDEKIFEGELAEYRGGRVLGGPAQSGEVLQVAGPIRIVFDTETSASITLPGEAAQLMKRFRFEDHLSRLHANMFTYSTAEEMVNYAKPGTIHVYAKDDNFRMEEELSNGGSCFYEGKFERTGQSIRSTGSISCKEASSRPNMRFYKIDDLRVDEYGVLTGRFNWSGWDAAGNPLSNSKTVVGVCSSPIVLLSNTPCLSGGRSFYTKQN